LPKDFRHPILNDSKQLSEKKRELLRPIIEAEALAFGVAHIQPKKIDEINILNASILAMHKAIDKLRLRPEFVLVDGNRFKPYQDIPYECMVKGDARFLNIAAASVLAKTYRDDFMKTLAQKYPHYQWENNKGYPTKAHRLAIRKHGSTSEHRKSFQLLPNQLEIEF